MLYSFQIWYGFKKKKKKKVKIPFASTKPQIWQCKSIQNQQSELLLYENDEIS